MMYGDLACMLKDAVTVDAIMHVKRGWWGNQDGPLFWTAPELVGVFERSGGSHADGWDVTDLGTVTDSGGNEIASVCSPEMILGRLNAAWEG